MDRADRCTDAVHEISRRLRSRAEAIFGAVFYTPEARAGALGLTPVQWYMAGRIAALGPMPAEVAIAVFGTFNPTLVHDGLDGVWDRVTPAEVLGARALSATRALAGTVPADGPELGRAITLLTRAIDTAETAGAPLYAALASLRRPEDPVSLLWRLCDMVREHRSDAHVSAWRSFGFAPVDICVLNDVWRGGPAGATAHNDMAWTVADVDAALVRLTDQGLATARGTITDAGRDIRDSIERATSGQQASMVDALGLDADELLELLDPWARAAVANYRRAPTATT